MIGALIEEQSPITVVEPSSQRASVVDNTEIQVAMIDEEYQRDEAP